MKNDRGSVLLVLMLLIATLSAMGAVALTISDSAGETAQLLVARKRSFYTTEGMRNIAIGYVKQYFRDNPVPPDADLDAISNDLAAFIDSNLAAHLPSGFSMNPVQVKLLAQPESAPITNGPYKGVRAAQTSVSLSFETSLTNNNVTAVGHVNSVISLAQISLFQFLLFADRGFSFSPGPKAHLKGRLQVNGNLCFSSGNGVYVDHVIASGKILHHYSSDCWQQAGSASDKAYFYTGPNFTDPVELLLSAGHGCTNCEGTGLNWPEYATLRFNGKANDSAHGVMPLKLRFADSAKVQKRWTANASAPETVSGLRFLIDPITPHDDSRIKEFKYAHLADIRIVDGVWYIKDASNPNNWPGIPIWSDHPGRTTDLVYGGAVGQDDIREYWLNQGKPWPTGDTPRGYSYYEVHPSTNLLIDDTRGVISYGSLYRTSDSDRRYVPGHWVGPAAAASPICFNGAVSVQSATGIDFLNALTPDTTFDNISCSGVLVPRSTRVLNAARSGFFEAHAYYNVGGTTANRIGSSNKIPVNFDVHQLQEALRNTAPGELGSYFMTNEFNGIVYVTANWPNRHTGSWASGSLAGFADSTYPGLVPYQGSNADPMQIEAAHAYAQQALPYQLCSNAPSVPSPAGREGKAGFDYDVSGGESRFKIPNCEDYKQTGSVRAFTDVIRIVNGKNLDKATLKNGLSIVTNLMMYVAGDVNTSSDVSVYTATDWVPMMVGSDQMTSLSNAWSDGFAPWGVNPSSNRTQRRATNTQYNMAALSVSSWAAMLENWSGRRRLIIGSVAEHGHSVYRRHGSPWGNAAYEPANRELEYDPHFEYMALQPPGAPLFDITATESWYRH